MVADTLVRDYLTRLERAAAELPLERRSELVGDVREHIETALARSDAQDEASIRNVLERLGPAEEIVAAELVGTAVPPARDATAAASPWGPTEIIAILLLTAGAIVLPFVGPLAGLVFVWASWAWTGREKAVASVIVLALLAVPLVGVIAARAAY